MTGEGIERGVLFHVMGKYYEIQMSVSINEVLLEHTPQ